MLFAGGVSFCGWKLLTRRLTNGFAGKLKGWGRSFFDADRARCFCTACRKQLNIDEPNTKKCMNGLLLAFVEWKNAHDLLPGPDWNSQRAEIGTARRCVWLLGAEPQQSPVWCNFPGPLLTHGGSPYEVHMFQWFHQGTSRFGEFLLVYPSGQVFRARIWFRSGITPIDRFGWRSSWRYTHTHKITTLDFFEKLYYFLQHPSTKHRVMYIRTTSCILTNLHAPFFPEVRRTPSCNLAPCQEVAKTRPVTSGIKLTIQPRWLGLITFGSLRSQKFDWKLEVRSVFFNKKPTTSILVNNKKKHASNN